MGKENVPGPSGDVPADMFAREPWKYSSQFAYLAQEEARLVFQKLDPDFNPEVRVIGLNQDQHGGMALAFIEPRDDALECALADVGRQVAHFYNQFRQRKLRHVGPGYTSAWETKGPAVQMAVECALRSHTSGSPWFSLISLPQSVAGQCVFILLRLQTAVQNRYPAIPADLDQSFPAGKSLVCSAADVFLVGCGCALRHPQPGSTCRVIDGDWDDVLRLAGKSLVSPMRFGLTAMERRFGFYGAIEQVSSRFYEGAGATGGILIAHKDDAHVLVSRRFAKAFRHNEHRAVRKMLELCSGDRHLLVTPFGELYGIGSIGPSYRRGLDVLCTVRFMKHHTWDLVYDDQILMRVEYGLPGFPKPPLAKASFSHVLRSEFPALQDECLQRLWLAVEAVISRPGEGATVVILDQSQARAESQRLAAQSVPIEPTPVDGDFLRMSTAIDGAVLVDTQCDCHAIGTILDGNASGEGDAARGARYHSALRYVKADQGRCAIVVSQDGSVDILKGK